MKFHPFKNTTRVVLEPGEYYVSSNQEVISTLLGSCIAVCLYEPESKIIGMNHFLLAEKKNVTNTSILESEEGRYGIHAMELLINNMMRKGASRSKLIAKCFGGASILYFSREGVNTLTVGEQNCYFIKQFLNSEKIPMKSSSLGGSNGRNIHFVGDDYSVYVKTIGIKQNRALELEERAYWNNLIREHENNTATSNKIDYW